MTWGTLTIKDSAGTDRTVPAFDISGAGTGPYIVGHTIVNDSGDGFATAEENAAAMTTLLGVAGRYDSSARTLGNGDAGAIALNVAGAVITETDITDDYARQLGRVKLVNDAGTVIDPVTQVAHDAADSGNPTKVGFKARDGISDVTLVAENDRTDAYAGLDGVQIVRQHAALGDIVSEVDTNTDGASTAFASGLAAPGAGIRICVTDVTLVNSSSSDITVDLRDGSAGSVIWTFPVPANGGVTHSFGVPLKLTANTALAYDASAATTTLTICAAGFLTKL